MIYEFLFETTLSTQSTPKDQISEFLFSLDFIASNHLLPSDMRSHASMAMDRIHNNSWNPRFVLMHGDLWKGNILLKNDSWKNFLFPKDFIIIDWTGSVVEGYPIYDLIRAVDSFKASNNTLRFECTRHAKALDCSFFDIRSYLLAALGHYGRYREHFPYESWVNLTKCCDQRLLCGLSGLF